MKRAGIYVDNLNAEATYQSFKPNPLPPIPEIEMDGEIVKLLVDANKQLVKLDTASQLISNADLIHRQEYTAFPLFAKKSTLLF